MNMSFVHAAPGRTVEASTAPFNLLEAAIELGRWERTLCPPDKMWGPVLNLFDTDHGTWLAQHRNPFGGDVVWSCEGADPHAVMGAFRAHLRECVA